MSLGVYFYQLKPPPFEPVGMFPSALYVRYSWLLGWGMISIFSMYVLLTNVTVRAPNSWVNHAKSCEREKRNGWWTMWIMMSKS